MPKPTFHNLRPEKRQRLIDAALDEFGTRPYGQATLARIADGAGVSKGSLYQYFENKVDLYSWLITGYMGERKLAAIADAAPGPEATLWEVLEGAFLTGFRFARAEPGLMRLGARFFRDYDQEPGLRVLRARNREAADAWMRALIQGALARGELRAVLDVELAVGFLTHALGEGMLDLLARRLGVGLLDLLDNPTQSARLTDDDVRQLVRGVLRMFRQGAGRTS